MTKTIFFDSVKNNVIEGESFGKFLENQVDLNEIEKENLRSSSINILSKCIDSKFEEDTVKSNIGLVIGKIQSGKTMSFTSVLSMARDNNYKVAIVISGRSNLLLKQTTERLKEDLEDDESLISVNPRAYDKESLSSILHRKLRRNKGKNRLYIIPVLKHQGHLRKITKHLKNPNVQNHLKTSTVLIFDDEADQASLNTYARSNTRKDQQNESAIFNSIKELKESLPNHTYLQYTATPQANLLIDTMSLLSPDWHVILNPGLKYTGGNEFFEIEDQLVRHIPIEGSYPDTLDELGMEPPKSLRSSICEFLILSALMGGAGENKKINNRATMLIHPTWRVNESIEKGTKGIKTFKNWTLNIIEAINDEIENEDYSIVFQESYDKLKLEFENDTEINFPKIEDIGDFIDDEIIFDLIDSVREVTGNQSELKEGFPWLSSKYHVLIGGQLLDRGFTVENLIVTYMPRDSKGRNQADTIEQRCRFYGYRKKYLKFCRVYLTKGMKQDYIEYNDHENEILDYLSKNTLTEFFAGNQKLRLSASLNPTNVSRISNNLNRSKVKGYYRIEPQLKHIHFNNNLLKEISENEQLEWIDYKPSDSYYQKNKNSNHKITKVEASMFFDFLRSFKTDNQIDTSSIGSIKRHIDYIKDKIENIWLVKIAPEYQRKRAFRYRSKLDQHVGVSALFFGGYRNKLGNIVYKDSDILIDRNWSSNNDIDYKNEIILQIHKISPNDKSETNINLNENIYIPNIYFPNDKSSEYIYTTDFKYDWK
jgi:hypothetical protein